LDRACVRRAERKWRRADANNQPNQGHNADIDRRYANPTRFGLPVLVVLDANGKALTTQDTGQLEDGDHHDPKKVLAFLNRWAKND
jgi:hypothetical protein